MIAKKRESRKFSWNLECNNNGAFPKTFQDDNGFQYFYIERTRKDKKKGCYYRRNDQTVWRYYVNDGIHGQMFEILPTECNDKQPVFNINWHDYRLTQHDYTLLLKVIELCIAEHLLCKKQTNNLCIVSNHIS